jgi:hypothetical protein
VLHELGLRLSLRQRAIATAQLLFLRFYVRESFVHFDPRLVAPTVLFVAAKIEECPLNAKNVIRVMSRLDTPVPLPPGTQLQANMGLPLPTAGMIAASAPLSGAAAAAGSHSAAASSVGVTAASAASGGRASLMPAYPYSLQQLLEMEFAVLNGINYDLVVWHPYRPLEQSVDL